MRRARQNLAKHREDLGGESPFCSQRGAHWLRVGPGASSSGTHCSHKSQHAAPASPWASAASNPSAGRECTASEYPCRALCGSGCVATLVSSAAAVPGGPQGHQQVGDRAEGLCGTQGWFWYVGDGAATPHVWDLGAQLPPRQQERAPASMGRAPRPVSARSAPAGNEHSSAVCSNALCLSKKN